MISIKHLRFQYAKTAPIFNDFNLHISKGAALSIIGPSGCGKTTLLYIIAGLTKPSGGVVSIAGASIKRPRPETGLVLQDHGLLPWATVMENAGLGLDVRAYYGPDGKHAPLKKTAETSNTQDNETADEVVTHWLKRLGIYRFRNHYPDQLSRGQRQRTAIARTLSVTPDLILLDEPFSALDAPIRSELQAVVRKLKSESGLTSVIVTHDIDEAVYMGENILVLGGKTNTQAHIIKNDLYAEDENTIRTHPGFMDMCQALRKKLEAAS